MISFLLTFRRLFHGIREAFHMKNFQALLSLLAAILLSGTIFYHQLENLPWLDALYFSVTTLATIGHPTFAPVTTLGKVFTMIYIVVGTGLFLSLIGYIAYALIKQKED
ncbi:potassium channel family protein [Exiguobacterium flavidum]|uniref:potassium channel family protein n=1 Tax=Exiguobacterium flavidum TaxID=2184695 RepID=UPI000DF818E4|nr:potassium channel family protein [Exiguobacterium flavidum]